MVLAGTFDGDDAVDAPRGNHSQHMRANVFLAHAWIQPRPCEARGEEFAAFFGFKPHVFKDLKKGNSRLETRLCTTQKFLGVV
jgi:hypothetical protein